MIVMPIVHHNQDIFGDTVRGGYGGEDDICHTDNCDDNCS